MKVWPVKDDSIFVGLSNGSIIMFDIREGKKVKEFKSHKKNAHKGSVHALSILNDQQLISGGKDTTIKIWDIATKKCISTLKEHTQKVTALHTQDCNHFISGSLDGTVHFWNNQLKEY